MELPPEEGHDGNELWGVLEEGLQGLVPEYGTKDIFNVCGDEDMQWTCCGEGAQIIHHFVGSCSHEGTVLEVTHGTHDARFGNVESETGGNFEEGFEHGDWPYTFTGLFAEWLNEASCPDCDRFVWDLTACPCLSPHADSFSSIGSLE